MHGLYLRGFPEYGKEPFLGALLRQAWRARLVHKLAVG